MLHSKYNAPGPVGQQSTPHSVNMYFFLILLFKKLVYRCYIGNVCPDVLMTTHRTVEC